jgi:hypothetical protein
MELVCLPHSRVSVVLGSRAKVKQSRSKSMEEEKEKSHDLCLGMGVCGVDNDIIVIISNIVIGK